MKKTYVTTMPDHVGAFLKASRCIAALGINITRVSYNKAVDMHTLFIEAEGSPEQLAQATERLREIGYLQSSLVRHRIDYEEHLAFTHDRTLVYPQFGNKAAYIRPYLNIPFTFDCGRIVTIPLH